MPELERACFVLSETTRGAALGSAALMRRAAGTPRYSELREELRARSAELASLVQEGATSESFHQALARREEVERELVTLARELSGGKAIGLDFDLDALAARLGEREAVVAYRRYQRRSIASPREVDAPESGGSSTGGPEVCQSVDSLFAFVVRPRSESSRESAGRALLTLVDLGPIAPIEHAVREWRAILGATADARGVPVGTSAGAARRAEESGRALRRLVFDPLEEAMRGADHALFVLDDVLHLVPLDALPAEDLSVAGGDPALLGDRLRIETRVTVAELLAPTEERAGSGELVAVGGVEYGARSDRALDRKPEETQAESAFPAAAPPSTGPSFGLRRGDDRAGILRGSPWAGGFKELPGTRAEARAIAKEFEARYGSNAVASLLEGGEATREKLLELVPKARWLHVATHGWFASESVRSWKDPEPLDKLSGLGLRLSGEEQVKGMSPMLLCGLALAGANLPEDQFGRVPGLIRAEEIAALDLSNCELAVLSACDTNVGERRAGQGVASLQKALQMAGARSVITSLWKVPDEATRELMTDFYRRLWVERKPKWQALWEAKTRLREAKNENGSPRYATRAWAAWVLTGEPD